MDIILPLIIDLSMKNMKQSLKKGGVLRRIIFSITWIGLLGYGVLRAFSI